jgi:hypothetical protein
VTLEANVANARVTFRRRVTAAPTTLQILPSDIVELVEVSAPGHKTLRYWLTFDRPTKLIAQLARGSGSLEATEEQTLIALGEVKAAPVVVNETPKVAAKPVEAPVAQPMTGEPSYVPRKIGRSADEMPVEVKEPVVAAVEPPQPEPVKEEPAPIESKPEPAPKPDPVALPEPAKPKTGFDQSTVSAVVGQNRGVVMKCVSDGKKSNAKMKGTVQVHLAVDASGKVKQVQVQSNLNAPLVASCIAMSAKTWKFPARTTTQIAMVSYPFTIN